MADLVAKLRDLGISDRSARFALAVSRMLVAGCLYPNRNVTTTSRLLRNMVSAKDGEAARE